MSDLEGLQLRFAPRLIDGEFKLLTLEGELLKRVESGDP